MWNCEPSTADCTITPASAMPALCVPTYIHKISRHVPQIERFLRGLVSAYFRAINRFCIVQNI
jgi:hypothetical protein